MSDRMEAIADAANRLGATGSRLLIAIDGRCAAGKTTLAARLQERWNCPVFHMDDFFLRPEQRTPERLREPGGNVDYERFLREVLQPLRAGREITYTAYNCHTKKLEKPVLMLPCHLNLVEGSYSCHPALWDRYDLHIFLTVDPAVQLQRIALRGADALEQFREKWIPLEERYFSACEIERRCELVFRA